jgi:phosphomannomutase
MCCPYRERIVGDVKLARPMKIVVDCGNGIAGASAPAIFRALGCEVIELFSEVDGNFPNHHPDPSKPENLRDLIAACRPATPSWAWPLTATATAWASSPRTAPTSSPTAR